MKEIKVGMTVRLRSGGPVLMVNALSDETGYVTCVWFDEDEHIGEYDFHVSALELVDAEEADIEDLDELQKIEDDGFDEWNEHDQDYDLFHEAGCGEGYSCAECDNVGCNAHPCN